MHILHILHIVHIVHIMHTLHNNAFFTYFAYYDSFCGRNDILVPVTPYLAGIFQYLRGDKKLPPRVRAVDMLHILLLLPFLLLEDVVQEYNRKHPLPSVVNPSSELIEITLLFIQWYQLYRRWYPPKDKVDIQDLARLWKR
jgi:hypothetical protein